MRYNPPDGIDPQDVIARVVPGRFGERSEQAAAFQCPIQRHARRDRARDGDTDRQSLLAMFRLRHREIDDPKDGPAVDIEDRRGGAGPALPAFAIMLGSIHVHGLHGRERRAHAVGPRVRLIPLRALDDPGPGRRKVADARLAGDVEHAPRVFRQDHDTGHLVEEPADLLDDRHGRLHE